MHNLSHNTKLIQVQDAIVAGTSTIGIDPIDTQGYDGVMIFGSIATADAGNYAKARQGALSDLEDAADLEGTKLAPSDDGNSFLIDIFRPKDRYVDIQVVRGVSTALGPIYALLYGGPRKAPAEQGSTINAGIHASPAEGTA